MLQAVNRVEKAIRKVETLTTEEVKMLLSAEYSTKHVPIAGPALRRALGDVGLQYLGCVAVVVCRIEDISFNTEASKGREVLSRSRCFRMFRVKSLREACQCLLIYLLSLAQLVLCLVEKTKIINYNKNRYIVRI